MQKTGTLPQTPNSIKKKRNINGTIIKANVLNINKMCRFRYHQHADININSDIGRIVSVVGDDGYAVEVTKKFKVGQSFVEQTNILYSEAKDIELL